MTDQSLKVILSLTLELRKYKSAFNTMRIKRQKQKLQQLEEPAYEWDFKD